jgi:hypothetical protein
LADCHERHAKTEGARSLQPSPALSSPRRLPSVQRFPDPICSEIESSDETGVDVLRFTVEWQPGSRKSKRLGLAWGISGDFRAAASWPA